MKKILSTVMALAIATLTFTACEDVPEPYPTPTASGSNAAETIGTLEEPITVAAALELINGYSSGGSSTTDAYVKGIVSSVQSFNDTYSSITYYISEDGTTTNQIQCYSGKGLNGADFTSKNDLVVGTTVIVKGKLKKYVNNSGVVTAELDQSNQIVYIGEVVKPEIEVIGTADAPVSIVEAVSVINGLSDGATTPAFYYVKGTISRINTTGADVAKYKNINYVISDGSQTLTVYKGRNLGDTDFTEDGQINVGDEVVIYGQLQRYVNNSGTMVPEIADGNYLVKLTKGEAPAPTADLGTAEAPLTVAKALELINGYADAGESETDAYVKGKIVSVESFNSKYSSITYYISDDGTANGQLQVYSGKGLNGAAFAAKEDLTAGATVIVKGKLKKYVKDGTTTPEINQNSQIVSIDGNTGGGTEPSGDDTPGGGTTVTSLTNGDFETWADGLPTGWKSASSASSATLTQSTDAHGGSFSVNINGKEGSNVRLATQEITLAAGTYVFTFYAKATTADKAQVRPGYVPVTDGKVGTYAYGNYADVNNGGWTQVQHEFTLDAETTVCLLVMNPKKSDYSSGKDVLVDDATLVKK